MPRIYYVNWFRQDANGHFIWPGYGENSRVLKWVFERVTGKGLAVDTAIGRLPVPESLDLHGLDISSADLELLLKVDVEGWLAELPLIKKYFEQFGDRLPTPALQGYDELEKRLAAAVV